MGGPRVNLCPAGINLSLSFLFTCSVATNSSRLLLAGSCPLGLHSLGMLYPLRCTCYRQPYVLVYGQQGLLKSTCAQRACCSCSAPTPLLLASRTGLVQGWALQVWDSEGADTRLALWYGAKDITYWHPVHEIRYTWMQINAALDKRFKRGDFFCMFQTKNLNRLYWEIFSRIYYWSMKLTISGCGRKKNLSLFQFGYHLQLL